MSELTPAQQLTVARVLVGEGWIKGSYYNDKSKCYCASGAMWTVIKGGKRFIHNVTAEKHIKAFSYLMAAIDNSDINSIDKKYHNVFRIEDKIIKWNDDRRRTINQVLEVFDRAINMAVIDESRVIYVYIRTETLI
jgi:hypothetical protein